MFIKRMPTISGHTHTIQRENAKRRRKLPPEAPPVPVSEISIPISAASDSAWAYRARICGERTMGGGAVKAT
jgi:hypothetical protein